MPPLPRRSALRPLLLALGCAALGCLTLGCSSPTEIVVVVDAHPETLAQLESLTLSIEGYPEPIAIEASALPATLGVQGRPGASGVAAVVRARLTAGGELEARGQLAFVSSSRQMLYLELDALCVDECGQGSCFRGVCRPAERETPCPFVRAVAEGGQALADLSHGCFEGVERDAGLDAELPDAALLDAEPLDGAPDGGPDAGCGPACEGWTQLALGPRHACGLRDGTAVCWGTNRRGQTGDDSFSPASIPVAVAGIAERVSAVDVGDRHSCALTVTGAVYCWGDGETRQLGVAEDRRSRAAVVPGVSDCSALALGPDFSCAICGDDSTVTCWGARHNLVSVLQDPMLPTPTEVSGVDGLTAGAAHVCAWNSGDGTSWCWGEPVEAVLGHGSAGPLAPPGLGRVRHIDAGREHTCALLVDSSIMCWGRSELGQAGVQAAVVAPGEAVLVSGDSFVAVSAGAEHSCAITGAGHLRCWGANTYGHLEDTAEPWVPSMRIDGRAGWTDVAVGTLATCGITADGERDCFGYDPTGLVSDQSLVQLMPQMLSLPVSDVTIGGRHACAQLSDTTKQVTCWGAGDMGQRGDGSFVAGARPPTGAELPGPVADLMLQGAVAGPAQTCAIEEDGADVYCWGDGSTAVVHPANPAAGFIATPRATGLFGIVESPAQLAMGARHACALTSTDFECWGFDDESQLGGGSTSLPAGTHSHITAGRAHTCIVAPAAFMPIWCWGSNTHGQAAPVGASSTPVSGPQPVDLGVPLRATPMDIAAGGDFSCVTDGMSVVCWGSNSDGQLGDVAAEGSVQTVPGLPASLLGVTAGAAHACAWTNTEAFCWGRNHSGQLSRAAVSAFGPPESISQLSGRTIVRMTAGQASTCAETVGGTYCWGSDEDWVLGIAQRAIIVR